MFNKLVGVLGTSIRKKVLAEAHLLSVTINSRSDAYWTRYWKNLDEREKNESKVE